MHPYYNETFILRMRRSPLSVASQRLLAMGAIGGVVARLMIPDDLEGCWNAQPGAWQHDRQQKCRLRQRQRRGFFLR
jgi:hypothetical protein